MNKLALTLTVILVAIVMFAVFLVGVLKFYQASPGRLTVPHEGEYGIYAFDPATNRVTLIYSTPNEIYTSALRLSNLGDRFVFAQEIDGTGDNNTEIFSIGIDGKNLKRLTNNSFWDLYPVWSPDDTKIAFLSKRQQDLDIYVMNADGTNQHRLYDSGSHDADIDWADGIITFTSRFKIWTIKDDGTGLIQVTNMTNAGQWGNANLPVGDYDPRLSPDGARIAFERLENASSLHGSYNMFVINTNGTGENRLTNTGYSQGLASWSHQGDRIVYIVAAVQNEGKYDMHMMNDDGTNNHNITPSYFPAQFLCYSPIFSSDDSGIYFIGQWQG